MKTGIKALRWFVCMPAGVLSSLAAAVLLAGLLTPVCGYAWLIDTAAGLLTGLVHPIVGYHAGRSIAPSKTRASRDLMLFPYGALGCFSVLVVFGQLCDGRPADPVVASAWWMAVVFYAGSALGCLTLLHPPTPRPTEQHDEREQPFASPFDWPASARN